MYLSSLDILVAMNDRNDLFSRFKRWLMGPYDHVGLYLGMMGTVTNPAVFPAVFESVGRGILIRDLRSWNGRKVVQVRILEVYTGEFYQAIFARAIQMASDYGSHYDFPAIIRWAIPRIILQKLRIPIPQTWKRDERHICSEAVYSVLEDSGIDVLIDTQVPLPGDFVDCSELYEVDRGYVGFNEKVKVPGVYNSVH